MRALVAHPRSILFDRIAEGSISGSPFCRHTHQRWNRFIDMVDNENFRLACMLAVQPSDI
jgi:hypothetical protein